MQNTGHYKLSIFSVIESETTIKMLGSVNVLVSCFYSAFILNISLAYCNSLWAVSDVILCRN